MPIHTSSIRAFLTKWETSQTVAYIPHTKRNFTGRNDLAACGEVIASSGVTIGTGVDLGQQTEKGLRDMGVPDALVDRFRPYLGLSRGAAVVALLHAPLDISATPDPLLPQEIVMQAIAPEVEARTAEAMQGIMQTLQAQNVIPDDLAMQKLHAQAQQEAMASIDLDRVKRAIATERAALMETVIDDQLKESPAGAANRPSWQQNCKQVIHSACLYERWGYLTGQELRDAGNAVSDEDLPKVFPANVWVLGNRVIKAMINPMEGVDIPYFFYPYQIDETAFWPEGIATAIRYPQAAINSATRATQDNAVLSSGPIIGVNMQALADGEDPTTIQARRVLLFSRSGMNLDQAFRAVTVPSCISENLTLIKFWQEAADEMSTPRFNAGDGRVSGAGETASGLSMLMGASNILLKDHVKDFDDHVTGPFIRSMYRWNMLFNPREDIKGDYEVSATGSQSLIAKEVRAQQIPGVMAMLQNPGFAKYIKDNELLKVALEQTDLPAERLLRSDDEAREYEQQQMLMAAQVQAEATSQALVAELEKQGATPEQIQQQLLLLLAQQQAQSASQGGIE